MSWAALVFFIRWHLSVVTLLLIFEQQTVQLVLQVLLDIADFLSFNSDVTKDWLWMLHTNLVFSIFQRSPNRIKRNIYAAHQALANISAAFHTFSITHHSLVLTRTVKHKRLIELGDEKSLGLWSCHLTTVLSCRLMFLAESVVWIWLNRSSHFRSIINCSF